MTNKLIYLFILAVTLSCGIDIDERTTILLNPEEKYHFPYKDAEIWKPKSNDLKTVERILEKAFYSNKSDFGVHDTIGLNDFYKQMVPYLNDNGERIVYVNGLCESFVKSPLPGSKANESSEIGWRKYFYIVDDGGYCFWQTQINIETLEYFDFSFNGF